MESCGPGVDETCENFKIPIPRCYVPTIIYAMSESLAANVIKRYINEPLTWLLQ